MNANTPTHPITPPCQHAIRYHLYVSTSLCLYGWTDGGMDVPIMYIYAFCDACVYCVRAARMHSHVYIYVHVC